jgi:hypothetical protein
VMGLKFRGLEPNRAYVLVWGLEDLVAMLA